jgi:hypothetical protein
MLYRYFLPGFWREVPAGEAVYHLLPMDVG